MARAIAALVEPLSMNRVCPRDSNATVARASRVFSSTAWLARRPTGADAKGAGATAPP